MALKRILTGNNNSIFVLSLSYLKTTNRCVHTVENQELTHYRDLLKQFTERSYQFQNIALCKQRGKDQPVILTDEWPNFSCTAVFQPWTSTLRFPTRNQRTSRLMLLSSCEEKLATFLNDTKLLQKGSTIAAIDSVTDGHLDKVAKTMFSGWQETPKYNYKSFCYPEGIPSKLNSDQFFVGKLKSEHADFIGERWITVLYRDVEVNKIYLRHILTMYDLSAGIFAKSDPSYPVSWGTYSDIGHAVCLQTLPEYRRKNFAMSLSAYLFAQLQQEGIVPIVQLHKDSALLDKGEKFIADSVWRDSITGECHC